MNDSQVNSQASTGQSSPSKETTRRTNKHLAAKRVCANSFSEVRIFGKTIRIQPFKDHLLKDRAAGANDVKLGLIEYDTAQTEDQLRDTILHEILHLIDYDMQLELSERQVHCLASGIFAVFKDNKDLTKWITK